MKAPVIDRPEQLEEKLDACLVLLGVLTAQDRFAYSLNDKSEVWIKAMLEARSLALHTAPALANRRLARSSGASDPIVDVALLCRRPTGTAASELRRLDSTLTDLHEARTVVTASSSAT